MHGGATPLQIHAPALLDYDAQRHVPACAQSCYRALTCPYRGVANFIKRRAQKSKLFDNVLAGRYNWDIVSKILVEETIIRHKKLQVLDIPTWRMK